MPVPGGPFMRADPDACMWGMAGRQAVPAALTLCVLQELVGPGEPHYAQEKPVERLASAYVARQALSPCAHTSTCS